jgi:hypothetical protein
MDKNDGMIYWPDPADEKTKGPTRGSNGCEWCIINLGRGNCTYISDLANCPLTDEQVILLNNFFLALQQRKLGPENEDAIRKAIAGEGRLELYGVCGQCWAFGDAGKCGDPDSGRDYVKPDELGCEIFEARPRR